jgi:hypothetical protein
MDHPQFEGLLGRLERLERHNRRLRLGGALLLLGIVAGATMGQGRGPSHAVEAQRFVVKDARGKSRAVLGMSAEGPGLSLYDPDGNARAALALAGDNTSRLGFYDRQGKSRVVVDVQEDGTSTVGFYDKTGKAHAHLRVAPDGSPVLGFFDKDGRPIWPGKLLLP